MTKEQPPIDLDSYSKAKGERKKGEVEKISRKKFIQDEIVRIGDDRWIALSVIVSRIGGVINPSKNDRYQAKQIEGMNDENLINHLKVTSKETLIAYPLSSRTLYNEIRRRMEDPGPISG